MKVTKHIEQLLRQGWKRKELIKLGFPKPAVARVDRQLREEKAALKAKAPKGTAQAENHLKTQPESPETIATIWQKVQSMANDLQRIDSIIQALPKVAVLMVVAQELGTYRRENCPYQEDGVCILRAWSSQADIPQDIGEPVFVENERSAWYIKPTPFCCAICTAVLKDRVDDVENQAFDTPLWGARYRITCEGCHSKGWVAIRIKCTKCGRETWRGWQPKQ